MTSAPEQRHSVFATASEVFTQSKISNPIYHIGTCTCALWGKLIRYVQVCVYACVCACLLYFTKNWMCFVTRLKHLILLFSYYQLHACILKCLFCFLCLYLGMFFTDNKARRLTTPTTEKNTTSFLNATTLVAMSRTDLNVETNSSYVSHTL